MEPGRFWRRTSRIYLRGFALASLVIGLLHGGLFLWRLATYDGPHRPGILVEAALVGGLFIAMWQRARRLEGSERNLVRMGWALFLVAVAHGTALVILHETALKTINLVLVAVACPLIFPFGRHYLLSTAVTLLAWLLTLPFVHPYHLEPWGIAWATALTLGVGIHLFVRRVLGDMDRLQQRDRRLLRDKTRLVAELREAMARVDTLQGLIPICAQCKKVRNDQGYWEQVEQFINVQTGRNLTHGYCPACYDEARKELERMKAEPKPKRC